jgi:hypothetical protein
LEGYRSRRFNRNPHGFFSKQESLAREIDNTTTILQRYEALIDDPNSAEFERIQDKYKAVVAKSKKLIKQLATLEAQIGAQNNESRLLFETDGVAIFRVGRTSKEDRLKLSALPRPENSTHRSDLQRCGSNR